MIKLENNWKMQSSDNIRVSGKEISSLNVHINNWNAVKVPTTVVNGLLQSGKIEDPYYNMNLKKMNGYKVELDGQNFESHYKPSDSPYRSSWWFRTEFELSTNEQDNLYQYWIFLKGIHYRSNIWLNGKRIAGSDHVIGSYRRFLLNITNFLKFNETNVIALEVFSSEPDELGISFVDWSPLPPDDDMGIWQPIYLCESGSVIIKNPYVKSQISSDLEEARISIDFTVENTSDRHEFVTIQGKIESLKLSKTIEIAPYEKRVISLTSESFKQLTIINPRIWWPYQLGSPELYELNLKLIISSNEEKKLILSDERNIKFGIREINSRINEFGSRLYQINGQDILVRGAGWTCDLMLRHNIEDDRNHIALLKNLNFNTVRLEGKLASDEFWDLCDSEGILVMAGWCCCSHWEKWDEWKAGDIDIALESTKSQLFRLRNHPSFMCWLYGSDFPPIKSVEAKYLEVLNELVPNLPLLSSASHNPSYLTGDSGVKMTGPYTYVPPIYWYDKNQIGGAENFNTETSPDVCIPPLESIKKMIPQAELRLDSDAWKFHAGLSAFKDTSLIERSVINRYGPFDDLPEFVKLSQILGYEAWRAMFEAYARNFPKGTGVIGWMLNSPWPSLIWQLYDYYFNANGAYYGSKIACEPIHIQYSYDDHSIWVINYTNKEKTSLTASIEIFDINSKLIGSQLIQNLSISKYDQISIYNLNDLIDLKDLPENYFLNLTLRKLSDPECESKNFYWLAKKQDILADEHEWPFTPTIEAADLSSVRNLPKTNLLKEISIEKAENNYYITVELNNPTDVIAFFIWAKIKDSSSKSYISPVYWNRNCISIVPKEKYILKAQVDVSYFSGDPEIEIIGFNTV